jgi:hypothetical protein
VNELKKWTIILLSGVAVGGTAFALANVFLMIYAEVHYPHPGSMVGFWAFFTAIPVGIAGLLGGMIFAFRKLK